MRGWDRFYTRSTFRQRGETKFVAGCRMPADHTIRAADTARRIEAEDGSQRLLAAILRYFERGGRG
jgi:hypothetical protein